MKITGIIAEYNPLHNGHIYHMEEARKLSGADGLVAVMSGDFVQRGEPALVDKYTRTRMALEAGVDAVFELPARCATGSAETFAAGGVAVLDSLGAVDAVAFGCEDADLEALGRLAEFLARETEDFRRLLKQHLRSGMHFAKARSAAIRAFLPLEAPLLDRPNNILAVEYLKAMKRRSSAMTPVAVPRAGTGHNESAALIRKAVRESTTSHEDADAASAAASDVAVSGAAASITTASDVAVSGAAASFCDVLSSMLPAWSRSQLVSPLFADDFLPLMLYRIRLLSPDEIAKYDDISPDLANAIKRAASSAVSSFEELVNAAGSRSFTASHVRRALFHILLDLKGLPRIDLSAACGNRYDISYGNYISSYISFSLPAVRLLGFRRGTPVLRAIMDSAKVPVVVKLADAPDGAFSEDILASDIYRLAARSKYGRALPDEYHAGPVILME